MHKNDINLFDETENFSSSLLTQKEDLIFLYKECINNECIEKFEELCFTGKYVNGLLKVIEAGISNPEVKSLDHIKQDLSINMEKVISHLKEITLNSSEDVKNILSNKYFSLNADSIKNLTALVSDLDRVKRYLNYLKRET
jgi:hypothetical protein